MRFVLMTNHYHLLVETPEANLVSGMRWFQTTYTVRHNRRHRLSGHLFQGRYKAVLVDPNERGYFALLSDYIHLNPVRARMISLRERLFDFPWSSYRWYAARNGRPAWFEPERVLGELGFEDTSAGRRQYAERMRERAVEELAEGNSAENERLRRGWCLGKAGFRERMLRLLEATSEKLTAAKEVDGAIRRSYGENEALRIIRAAEHCFGLAGTGFHDLKRNDQRKVALTRLLRERTSVSNRWIAAKLELGHVSNVSRYCSERRRAGEAERGLIKWLETTKDEK